MASTNYTGTQLAPYLYGRVDTLTNAARAILRSRGTELRIVTAATDVALTFGGVTSSTPVTYTLDGVAQSDPSFTANTPTTVATGLSDGPTLHTHSFKLKTANEGIGNFFTLANTCLTLTGAAPALSADPGFGPYKIGRSGLTLNTLGLDYSGSSAGNENPQFGSNSFNYVAPLTGGGAQGSALRVRGRADQIWAFIQGTAKRYAVYKDGALVGSGGVLNTSAQLNWVQLATGVDDGGMHDWDVVTCGNGVTIGATGGGGGGGSFLDGIMLGGASAAFDTVMPTVRRGIMCGSHSIGAGVDGGPQTTGPSPSTGGDISLAWPGVLSRLVGKDLFSVGRPGALWLACAQQGVNDLEHCRAFGIYPDQFVVQYGRNDTVQATVRTNVAAFINNLLQVPWWSGKIVIVREPIITGGGWSATGALVNAGIAQGVADVGSSRASEIDVGDSYTANDGTHFDQLSHINFATAINASGAMATASSTGVSGSRIFRGF